MTRPAPGHFTGDAHAFACGAIFGAIIIEARKDDSAIDDVQPELDTDGNYKPMLTVEMFGRKFRVIVAEVE